jgi:hypothetical protein
MERNALRPRGRASRGFPAGGALRDDVAAPGSVKRRRPGGAALLTAIGMLGAMAVVAAPAHAIPDDRVYELVSPGTEGPDYNPREHTSGVMPGVRASSTDDAVAFQTLEPPTGTTNRRGQLRTYAARRTADGWVTQTVSPESVTDSSIKSDPPRFTAFNFTDDITKGLFTSQAPADHPVVAGEPAPAVNLYRQDLSTGENLLLSPMAPILASSTSVPAAPRVAWASADLEHAVFDVKDRFYPGGPNEAVYAWSADRGVSIASILPDGKVASGGKAGNGPSEPVDQGLITVNKGFYGSSYGAISEDGSRIYFTGSGPSGGAKLFVRRDHGTRNARTVEIGLPESGLPAVPSGNPAMFQAASKDGRRVLFTSCGKLTADSKAVSTAGTGACSTFGFLTQFQNPYPAGALINPRRPELYLYDEDANGGAGDLIDLTTTDPTGAGVLGIVSLTEDFSRIYFAATGVLAPGGTQDKPNLYVWDAADGISFVAPLRVNDTTSVPGIGDAVLWASVNSPRKNAYMTPDGKHLAFSMYGKVDPSFDNRELGGFDILRQVYLYTYGEGAPVCVTCSTSGRNASEGTIAPQRLSVPELSTPAIADWSKRSMTDDGRELYFESGDKLAPTDNNVFTDVYVYRPETARTELISTGQAGPSSFAGASADGLNVFFRTSAGIAGIDRNGASDLYTARLRRGEPVPDRQLPIDPCQGDACPDTPPSTILGPSTNLGAVPGFDVAEIDGPRRSTWRRTGRMTLPVTTPGAGTITVRVRGTIRTTVKSKAKAKKGKKAKPKYKIVRATVAQAVQAVPGPGSHGVELKLAKAARAQLKRTRKLSVTVEVRFGAARDTTDVRLVLPKAKAKKPAKKKTTKKQAATKAVVR